ncbi:class I SAM-dependent methyltransferase [Patescibacteria group bacterium]|nr:class I SAM-dependent methyltransferase [Patescibacteria group bacterium]
MDQKILHYLKELKEYGIKNNIPNVTEAGGEFLNNLIKTKFPKNILEIGCANGYSTIWMAEAAKSVGAKVYAIDHSIPSMAEAKNNLMESGLQDYVDFTFDDAIKAVSKFPQDLMFDFVFVDGEKRKYLDFWNAIQSRLSAKAVVVFDDMIKFPEKTKSFSDAVESIEGFDKVLLPIDSDDGILLLTKSDQFPISNFQFPMNF